MLSIKNNDILNIARRVIKIESEEVNNLSLLLDDNFSKAIKAILNSKGKFIICGMGKSGIIGKKIAATLASTGTASFFLHPGEAYHGDLGMIEKEDIILLISNSGETDEILKIIPFLKSQGNIAISMSGNPNSTLAINTNYHLNIAIEKEACPLSLAPMSSTTATLVMGDAIAAALMKLKDFKDENFAKFHPGGSLGKKLLTKVSDIMIKDNLPICKLDTNIKNIIHIITKGESGLVVVIDNNIIKGIITDGDIRRTMEDKETEFFSLQAQNIMTKNPKSISQNIKLNEASELMSSYQVNALIVINSNQEFVGIIKMYNIGI